jgi:hypothetical protein
MEAMTGISLYSYPLSQLAKMLCLSYYCLSILQQNWKRRQNMFCLQARGLGGEEGAEGKGEKWPKQCMHK